MQINPSWLLAIWTLLRTAIVSSNHHYPYLNVCITSSRCQTPYWSWNLAKINAKYRFFAMPSNLWCGKLHVDFLLIILSGLGDFPPIFLVTVRRRPTVLCTQSSVRNSTKYCTGQLERTDNSLLNYIFWRVCALGICSLGWLISINIANVFASLVFNILQIA